MVTTFVGSSAGNVDGVGSLAKISGPIGIAVDTLGMVYVADYGNNAVRKIGPAGTRRVIVVVVVVVGEC